MRAMKVAMGLVTLLAAPAAVGQSPPAKSPAKTAAQAPAKAGAAKAAAPSTFNRALLAPSKLVEKAPEEFEAKFLTTRGEFIVKVTRAWAPNGADRFYNLVKNGFFDGAHFFRAIEGFMVQFGISAFPQVSKVWQAATIKDDPVKQSNRNGFITFAMTSEKNSRTTQVFINYGNNSRLDSMGFAPFGQVTKGMDVVVVLYTGYGEGAPQGRGPSQERIQSRGAAYLDKEFPRLDKILSAAIIFPATGATAAPGGGKAPAKKTP
jgi:peptidyl-prolyl cis-trans isomerase A (cyclophilin A)